MAHVVIGTRSDALAVKQATYLKTQLEHIHTGLQVGLEVLTNDSTDWLNEASLALFSRRVDAIVHHLCDLSPRLPEDFHLAAITERLDARDAMLVSPALRETVHKLRDLPAHARVIANGGHRRVQIVTQQPQVLFVGESYLLETALRELNAGAVDALVADALSLSLLGAETTACFDATEFIPAAGQGAFTLQSRLEDQRTNLLLESLNHAATRTAVNAERTALRNLYGEPGDAIAVSATHCVIKKSPSLALIGLVGDATLNAPPIRVEINADPHAPDLAGSALAMQLLQAGARDLLAHARTAQAVAEQSNDLGTLYPQSFAPQSFAEDPAPLRHAASAFQGTGTRPVFETTTVATAYRPNVFNEAPAPEFDLVASKVSRLRQQHPLHERRILLASGPRTNQDELTRKLEALGASVVTLPKLRATEPTSWESLDKVLVHISWYDWLIFTSAASVTATLNRCAALGHHLQEIEGRRLCAVGKATVNALRSAGLSPDLVLPQFTPQNTADTLAAEWEARYGKRDALRGKTMLCFTEQNFAEQFAHASQSPLRATLDQLGVYVEAVASYQYAPQYAPHEWESGWQTAFDYALFFDATSFDTLMTLSRPNALPAVLANTRIATLSQEAHKTAQAHGLAPLRLTQTHPPALVKWLREDCARAQAA
jgi:hydroxymethylbilane synthase